MYVFLNVSTILETSSLYTCILIFHIFIIYIHQNVLFHFVSYLTWCAYISMALYICLISEHFTFSSFFKFEIWNVRREYTLEKYIMMGKIEGWRQGGRYYRMSWQQHWPFQNYHDLHQIDSHTDLISIKSPWLRIMLKAVYNITGYKNTFINFRGGFLTLRKKSPYKHMSENHSYRKFRST